MATTLAELELKFKSEIEGKSSKDVAAVQRVTAEVRKAQAAVDALRSKEEKALAARSVSTGKQQGVVDDLAQRLDSARARVKELSSSGTPPAVLFKAKEQAANLAGKLEDAKAKLAQLGARDIGTAARTEAERNLKQIQAARPELERLAVASAHAGEEQKESTLGALMWNDAVQKGAEIAKDAAVAIIRVGASYLKFAIDAASAARSARLLGEALTGSASLGTEFNAIVKQLSGDVPIAKTQIAALAQELSLLRLGRRDLQAGLTAIEFVTSALGDSAGAAVKSIVEASAATRRFSIGIRDAFGEFTGLRGTGLKSADVIGALAKQLKTSTADVELRLRQGQISLKQGMLALEAAAKGRFGKIVALQMLDLNVQFDKAKENLAGMFAGVDLEPFLAGLKELLSIFDTTTIRGKAMQAVLTAGLSGLARVTGVLLPIGKEVFLGMAIAALKFYVAVRPVGRAIAELVTYLAGGKASTAWLEVGKFLFVALAASIALVGAAIFIAFIPLMVLGAVVIGIGYAIYKAIQLIIGVVGAVRDGISGAVSYLGSISWADLGANLVNSLIAGVKAGAGALLASVTSLGTDSIKAFKASVGIASPSKAFTAFGLNISASTASGVEKGAPQVSQATADLGGAAIGGALRATTAPSAGSAGAPINITIQNLTIGGREAGPDERASLASALVQLLNIATGQAGAGQPAGAF